MATLQDIETRIDEIDSIVSNLTRYRLRGGPVVIEGNEYSVAELQKFINDLTKESRDLKKLISPVGKSRSSLSKAEKQLAEAQRKAEDPKGLLNKTGTLTASEKSQKLLIEKARKDVARLEKEVSALGTQVQQIEKSNFEIGEEPRDFPGSPELAAAYRRAYAEPRSAAQPSGATGPTGPATTTGGVGGGGGVALTPEERKARREAKKEKQYAKAEQMMKQMFPQQAWLWDVDQTKFPGLRQVLLNGYKNRAWESDEGINRWLGELQNSDFYIDLRDKGTMRKITSVVGDLGFDDDNMGRLLRDAVNFDWDDDTLKLESYKEAFRKNADGTYVHSNAEARARKSTDYLRVQRIGTAYFNQLDDMTVQNVLTGGMIEDDVLRQQRELAKAKYGHLANLIDQGLSMEAITQSYRDEAARLLEVDPNSINMGDAKYQSAYDFMDPSNQKRLMTTGEWVRQLRTDSQYGWDKTENAKKEARTIASSIVQSFGRVS